MLGAAPAYLSHASYERGSAPSGLGVIPESHLRRLGSQVFDDVGGGHEGIGEQLSALERDGRDHASPNVGKEDAAARNACRIELSQAGNRREVRTRRGANGHGIGEGFVVGTHGCYRLGPGDWEAEVCLGRS